MKDIRSPTRRSAPPTLASVLPAIDVLFTFSPLNISVAQNKTLLMRSQVVSMMVHILCSQILHFKQD
jgi:hypothetical protein